MYFSGRELFLADASLFVDDAEAYEKYQRQEEPEASEEKVYLTRHMHVINSLWTETVSLLLRIKCLFVSVSLLLYIMLYLKQPTLCCQRNSWLI